MSKPNVTAKAKKPACKQAKATTRRKFTVALEHCLVFRAVREIVAKDTSEARDIMNDMLEKGQLDEDYFGSPVTDEEHMYANAQ